MGFFVVVFHHTTEPRDIFQATHLCFGFQTDLSCVHTVRAGTARAHWNTENNCPTLHMPWSTFLTKEQKNTLPWQHSTEITVGLLWENLACASSKHWWQSWQWTSTTFPCLQLIKVNEQIQECILTLLFGGLYQDQQSTSVTPSTHLTHPSPIANVLCRTTFSAILYSSSLNSFSLLVNLFYFAHNGFLDLPQLFG